MAMETATVTARIQPEVKREAEAVLKRLGVPVSVLIDALYRQIIFTGGVPYPLTVPRPKARNTMTDEEFDAIMRTGYDQALSGAGLSLEQTFERIYEDI